MSTRMKRFWAANALAAVAVLLVASRRTEARHSECTAEAYNRCNDMATAAYASGDQNAINRALAYCKASGCLAN